MQKYRAVVGKPGGMRRSLPASRGTRVFDPEPRPVAGYRGEARPPQLRPCVAWAKSLVDRAPASAAQEDSDIVCVGCNTGLGDLPDDLVPLIRSIDYLKGDLWLIQRESPGVYRLCS